LGAVGFDDQRTDKLASAFIADDAGEGTGQFVRRARAQGQVGLDPESML
jgi:hypothetical protein